MFLIKKLSVWYYNIGLLIFFALISLSKGIELRVISTMPQTITNVNLGHYDIGATGKGPTMFIIEIDNINDTCTYTNLQIRYLVNIESIIFSNEQMKVYEGLTDPFPIAAGELVRVLSNDFLQEDNPDPNVRFHQENRVSRIEDKTLEEQILSSARIPSGNLEMVITLETSAGEIIGQESLGAEITNVTRVNLISPGRPIDEELIEVFNPYPVFTWSSNLTADMYQNCDLCSDKNVFELRIYKKQAGQSDADILNSTPIRTVRLTQPIYQYPSTGIKLEEGMVYYWEVVGLLKGIVESEIKSEPYMFVFKGQANYQKCQFKGFFENILIGTDYESLIDKVAEYNGDCTVKLNGKIMTFNELLGLENEFLSNKYTVINARQD